ncbi:hypothetical protein PI124_g7245 [Phytophthora idaei]|nr:hypothetical protein PI126_g8742 [Phytophthora idaei]KAG3248062.1 hypothetical protein PI124_g7245 [Phytophthora idaei]
MQSENIYSDYTCTSVPISMSIVEASSCVSSSCAVTYIGTEYYYTETTCPSDAKSYAASTYGSTKYLLVDVHTDIDCSSYSGTAVIIASGTCEVIGTTGQGIITNVFSNGSAQFQYFMDSTCTYASSSPYVISKDLLTSHACFQGFKLYSNSDGSTTSGASQNSDTDGSSGTTGSGDSSGKQTGGAVAPSSEPRAFRTGCRVVGSVPPDADNSAENCHGFYDTGQLGRCSP